MLVRFNRALDSSLLLSKASTLPKDIIIQPDLSHEERLTESLLLKLRWQQVQNGTDCKHIKLHSNKIYIQNKLYGEDINSQ